MLEISIPCISWVISFDAWKNKIDSEIQINKNKKALNLLKLGIRREIINTRKKNTIKKCIDIDNIAKKSLKIFLSHVKKSNKNAIHLYEKLGFVTEGIRKNFYEKPLEDGLIMWKRVKQQLENSDYN